MGLEEFGKPLEDSHGLGMIVFSADEETGSEGRTAGKGGHWSAAFLHSALTRFLVYCSRCLCDSDS